MRDGTDPGTQYNNSDNREMRDEIKADGCQWPWVRSEIRMHIRIWAFAGHVKITPKHKDSVEFKNMGHNQKKNPPNSENYCEGQKN
jgi:hypothetical protein